MFSNSTPDFLLIGNENLNLGRKRTSSFVPHLKVLSLLCCISLTSLCVFAEESKVEKVEAETQRAANKLKETARNSQDKICETIHGKVECFPAKVKNKAKTLQEKAKVEADAAKEKLD